MIQRLMLSAISMLLVTSSVYAIDINPFFYWTAYNVSARTQAYNSPSTPVNDLQGSYDQYFQDCISTSNPTYSCMKTTLTGLTVDPALTINGLTSYIFYHTAVVHYKDSEGNTGSYPFNNGEVFNGRRVTLVTGCPTGFGQATIKNAPGVSEFNCRYEEPVTEQCALAGNPINYLTRDKIERQADYSGRHGLSVVRQYPNQRRGWVINPTTRLIDFSSRFTGESGVANVDPLCHGAIIDWRRPDPADNNTIKIFKKAVCLEYVKPHEQSIDVVIRREDGLHFEFEQVENAFTDHLQRAHLEPVEPQTDIDPAWVLHYKNGKREYFDRSGLLRHTRFANNDELFYSYDAHGRVHTTTNRFGDVLTFTYSGNNVSSVTLPDGQAIAYGYEPLGEEGTEANPFRLTTVTHEDNTTTTYHYDVVKYPLAMTGVTDSKGVRYATWEYDFDGRAISSEHAGGVDRHEFSYNRVTNPLGKVSIFYTTRRNGKTIVNRVTGEASENCVAANRFYQYYPDNNLVKSQTDWEGNTTEFTYDHRGLETQRIEAANTPEERTINTQWHSTLSLPIKVTELPAVNSNSPGRETIYQYDSEGRLLNTTTTEITP